MFLYFTDPVSLIGCTTVPCSLVLNYATNYNLEFECVSLEDESPVNLEDLGIQEWTVVVTPTMGTTDKSLASAVFGPDKLIGNKFNFPFSTFSSRFYCYTAGIDTAPAIMCFRGYRVKGDQNTCAATFQFKIGVQGNVNQDLLPGSIDELGAALQEEIHQREEADANLQQQIDNFEPGSGDVEKVAEDLKQEIEDRKEADAELDERISSLENAPSKYNIEANPAVDMPAYSPDFGVGYILDSTRTQLTFFDQTFGLKGIKIRCTSMKEGVTGTVALVPVLGGQEQPEIVIPVIEGGVVADLDIVGEGSLVLRRDTSSQNDTLKDGSDVIGLFIYNIWKIYEV